MKEQKGYALVTGRSGLNVFVFECIKDGLDFYSQNPSAMHTSRKIKHPFEFFPIREGFDICSQNDDEETKRIAKRFASLYEFALVSVAFDDSIATVSKMKESLQLVREVVR